MERKKIGLALSGGGARGFAHVGVLKVLAAHNIPIDMVAGTSAGSIVGGALAAGMSVDEIVAMTRKVRFTNMMRPSFSIGGMLSNAPMGHFLTSHFPVARFEDLAIPFAAVAYDPAKGKTVILKDTGDLITAIRTSCAVPGLFAPVKYADGRPAIGSGAFAGSFPAQIEKNPPAKPPLRARGRSTMPALPSKKPRPSGSCSSSRQDSRSL